LNKRPILRFPGAKLIQCIGLNLDIFLLCSVEDDVGQKGWLKHIIPVKD
jgi:hypothetical protein